MKTNYPDTVQKWLDGVYNQLKDDGFFEEHELEISDLIEEKEVEEISAEDWSGADMLLTDPNEVPKEIPKVDVKTMTTTLFQVIVKIHVHQLKREGTVDSIENEKGEEIMWVTEKGKKEIKDL